MQDYLSYEALSDEEIQKERGILQPGDYQFEVISAEQGLSKTSGNPQITLKIKVWDNDGKTYTLRDWLVLTRNMAWKLKHFWESVGHPDKYNGKIRADDCLNQSGIVRTEVEKDSNDNDRPKVIDYISPDKMKVNTPSRTIAKTSNEFDDDIPF